MKIDPMPVDTDTDSAAHLGSDKEGGPDRANRFKARPGGCRLLGRRQRVFPSPAPQLEHSPSSERRPLLSIFSVALEVAPLKPHFLSQVCFWSLLVVSSRHLRSQGRRGENKELKLFYLELFTMNGDTYSARRELYPGQQPRLLWAHLLTLFIKRRRVALGITT